MVRPVQVSAWVPVLEITLTVKLPAGAEYDGVWMFEQSIVYLVDAAIENAEQVADVFVTVQLLVYEVWVLVTKHVVVPSWTTSLVESLFQVLGMTKFTELPPMVPVVKVI